MENTNIKKWYQEAYPNDECGEKLDDNSTFKDLFTALDEYQDVYEVLGYGDSIIRERAFAKLSEIMNVDYGEIYNQWLGI